MRLLISRGAELSKQDGRGFDAVMHASEAGQLKSLEVLAEAGASLEQQQHSSRETALHVASCGGQTEVAVWLVQQGVETSTRDHHGRLAVGVAVDTGHIGTSRALMEEGAAHDIDSAAALGELSAVKALLAAHADPNALDRHDRTALMKAASGGHADVVGSLIGGRADPQLRDHSGDTALHWASSLGQLSVVRALVNAGMAVNTANESRETALHLSSSFGHSKTVGWLIKHKAELEARDGRGRLAVTRAASAGHIAVVQLLLDLKCDPSSTDAYGENALLLASGAGHTEVVGALLAAGVDADTSDAEGFTALMAACEHARVDVSKLLLTAGANVNALDSGGGTALMYSVWGLSAELASLLLAGGADPAAADFLGRTVLMKAVSVAQLPLVDLLLAHRADVSAADSNGETAITLAEDAPAEVKKALSAANNPTGGKLATVAKRHGGANHAEDTRAPVSAETSRPMRTSLDLGYQTQVKQPEKHKKPTWSTYGSANIGNGRVEFRSARHGLKQAQVSNLDPGMDETKKMAVGIDPMPSTGFFSLMKRLFVSCGPVRTQPDEVSVTAPTTTASTTKLSGQFVSWSAPDFVKRLLVSCGPVQVQPDHTATTAEPAPVTKNLDPFVSWAKPGAPAPNEKLFVSWAEPSWAS